MTTTFVQADGYLECGTSIKGDLGRPFNTKMREIIDKLFENEWFKEHVALMKYLGSSFKYRPLVSPCILFDKE